MLLREGGVDEEGVCEGDGRVCLMMIQDDEAEEDGSCWLVGAAKGWDGGGAVDKKGMLMQGDDEGVLVGRKKDDAWGLWWWRWGVRKKLMRGQ